MHEVGIAQNILEVIQKEAEENNSNEIKKVKLLLGEFTGVVREALEFAFDILKKDTLAKDAELEIETKKLKTYCSVCKKNFNHVSEPNFICNQCGNALEIIEGREMEIEYIDIN